MKALVLGGNRFFGKRLVNLLLASGASVTVFNRGHGSNSFDGPVETLLGDRAERGTLPRLVEGKTWDVVFDNICFSAAEAREACASLRPRVGRCIFTSSLSVYPSGADLNETDFDPRDYRFTEEADPKKDYAEGKRQCEAVFAREWPDTVSARFPLVFGPDDYTERLLWHFRKIAAGEPVYFPNPAARMVYISSPNAASALLQAVDATVSGGLNLASPEPLPVGELYARAGAALEMEAKLGNDPAVNSSPFGVEQDWFMRMDLAASCGVALNPLDSWLPSLLATFAAQVKADRPRNPQ
jgi:nucleoside-diphosphate-sugar epimerase